MAGPIEGGDKYAAFLREGAVFLKEGAAFLREGGVERAAH